MDSRDAAAIRSKPIFILYTDNDEELYLPTHKQVCGLCEGKGSHVNPSIDSNGLSSELMQDSEFMDSYMNGVYDVRCYECNGSNVVDAVDFSQLSEDQAKQYLIQLEEERYHEIEHQSELRMGC
tara:strand:+ start:132 stop:503 length:372 start_codon:yes stop_codon:yes gene_type:complete